MCKASHQFICSFLLLTQTLKKVFPGMCRWTVLDAQKMDKELVAVYYCVGTIVGCMRPCNTICLIVVLQMEVGTQIWSLEFRSSVSTEEFLMLAGFPLPFHLNSETTVCVTRDHDFHPLFLAECANCETDYDVDATTSGQVACISLLLPEICVFVYILGLHRAVQILLM